jgi:hypothetical protein
MANIKKQRYSDYQVEGIYNTLSTFHKKGNPIDYKIQVDGMDVVPRTNDVEAFFLFNDMVTETSRTVEIFIFKGKSLRCERFHFVFENYWYEETNTVSKEQFDLMMQKAVAEERVKFDHEQVKKENESLKGENVDLKNTCEQQHRIIEELEKERKKKKEKKNGTDLGETLEKLAIPILSKILPQETPIGNEKTLGTIEISVPERPLGGNELVIYLKKEWAKTNLTEQDFNDLLFAYHFRDAFANEASRIDKILALLYQDKSKIVDIEKLLGI